MPGQWPPSRSGLVRLGPFRWRCFTYPPQFSSFDGPTRGHFPDGYTGGDEVLPRGGDAELANLCEPVVRSSAGTATPQVRVAAPFSGVARLLNFTSWALLTIGALLRTAVYLQAEPLWGDEATLAANFSRPLCSQIAGLDYKQVAPPGFLLLTRLSFLTFGDGELALRLVPLLAGLLALPLFYRLARRLLPPFGVILATALFALSPYLIYYSTEVKQYSLDVLVAIGLTLATLRTVEEGFSVSAAIRLGVLGLVLVWFSQTAVFVLAGMGMVLAVWQISAGRRWQSLLVLAVFWGIGAGAATIASYSVQTQEQAAFMRWFWLRTFIPVDNPRVWLDALLMLIRHPGSIAVSVSGLLALVGLWFVPRNRRFPFALLLTPLAVAFAASMLQLYPWSPLAGYFRSGRLLLFAAPALLLGIAAGAAELARHGHRLLRVLGTSLMVVLPLQPAALSYTAFIAPGRGDDLAVRRPNIKPLMEQIAAEIQPGDRIFVLWTVAPVFAYYADEYPALQGARIQRREPDAILPSGRNWFLYQNKADLGGMERIQRQLNQLGQPVRVFTSGLPALLLYDVLDMRTPAERQVHAREPLGVFHVLELVIPSDRSTIGTAGDAAPVVRYASVRCRSRSALGIGALR